MKEVKLRRVLVLADSPNVTTGFGVLTNNIFRNLNKLGIYAIDILAINHFGDFYNGNEYPYRLYPAINSSQGDVFGRPRLINALAGLDKNMIGPWDILFTVNDHFVIEAVADKIKNIQNQLKEKGYPGTEFKWIGYWPVDSTLRENWVTKSIALSDYPVAYTEYGKEEILKWDREGDLAKRLKVIYHGVDTSQFYPIAEKEKQEFKEEYFGGKVNKDTFIVTTVARNQYRKDLARTMKIFTEFKKYYPNSFLYIHGKESDNGGSLAEIGRNFGLVADEDFTTPGNYSENKGFPTEILNKIYNVSDVTLSTTLGEGWGFMFSESMATGTLTIGPRHTSVAEIIGEDRGLLIDCGTTTSEWICGGIQDNERIRPLTNVADGVKKLTWAYENPEEAKKLADNGYKWIQQYKWELIAMEWAKLFDQAYQELERERAVKQEKLNKLNRKTVVKGGGRR